MIDANSVRQSWSRIKWVALILGLVLLFNLFFTPGFFKVEIKSGHLYGSVIDIVHRSTRVMLVALGMSLVIATGGVDLSVGAIMAVIGSVAAQLAVQAHAGFPLILVSTLALGAALGLWNGALVAFIGVQPIIATLILMVAGRGIAQLLTDGQVISFDNPGLIYLGRGYFAGVPFTFTLVLAAFLLTAFLTRKTALGLFIESTGDNEIATRFSGVNTRFVKCFVYAASGFFSAVSGLVVAADIKAADANNAGLYMELDAILAVVLGGTALTGGRFFLFNSLIGAILIQSLTTTILTRGVPVEYTLVVKAIIILLVCLVQSERFRAGLGRLFLRKHASPA